MREVNDLIEFYKEYIQAGRKVTSMNTESCRSYLQEKSGRMVEPEDVLWLFYHADELEG